MKNNVNKFIDELNRLRPAKPEDTENDFKLGCAYCADIMNKKITELIKELKLGR